jgi:hypothetical protein
VLYTESWVAVAVRQHCHSPKYLFTICFKSLPNLNEFWPNVKGTVTISGWNKMLSVKAVCPQRSCHPACHDRLMVTQYCVITLIVLSFGFFISS